MKKYLEKIVEAKRKFIKENYNTSYYNVKNLLEIGSRKNKKSFYEQIKKEGLSIIGEIKKASPSKGVIRKDFDPLSLSKRYGTCVDAISVLTEENFFQGKDEYLEKVSENVELPTLCKDFIIDEIQIYNAKALGASAILLIVNILTKEELKNFYNLAKSIGLDILVETHTLEEINIALEIGADIIGINNRNLETFFTNIENTIKLRKYIPDNILVVSESGIKNKEDVKKLFDAKIHGVLIGEVFMKNDFFEKLAKDFKEICLV